ncbi:Iron-binding zinc finger CDGSH type [Arthrobacter saudimassiliensis]|uniref:Iron-binding zinc finger CDGSH type n=1 Tax=Arthrobacter saudimassiliensis TaxID=1461584 RepID=A0A078MNW6_9MICC|nr:Iron-binding zinc finger CDGSH type [Arthrobacter saudimassiliensis]
MSRDDQADGAAASIVAYPNGPLLVRGNFEIVTPEGEPVPRDRETVALCRCGGSAIKPFCDGRHKLLNFETESSAKAPTSRTRSAGTGCADTPADLEG